MFGIHRDSGPPGHIAALAQEAGHSVRHSLREGYELLVQGRAGAVCHHPPLPSRPCRLPLSTAAERSSQQPTGL